MDITWFDFTGLYQAQRDIDQNDSGDFPATESPRFVKSGRYHIDCHDILGTNAYCDAQAANTISERMRAKGVTPAGVHFLDNGNYHYVSHLITRDIAEPYALVMIDRHPDLRAAAFTQSEDGWGACGGAAEILSCGGWVLEALTTQPLLRQVVLVGVDETLYEEECAAGLTQEMLRRITRIATIDKDADAIADGVLRALKPELPVYLSIDKDVLSADDVETNWDQGELRLDVLCDVVSAIIKERKTIGADICGAPEFRSAGERALQKNARADVLLLRALSAIAP